MPYKKYHSEEEISNWPRGGGLLDGFTSLPQLAIALTTALYGGLHAAAWSSYFASAAEKWSWRVSSIIIASPGLYVVFGMAMNRIYATLFYSVSEGPWRKGWRYRDRKKPFWKRAVLAILDCLAINTEFRDEIPGNPVRLAILCTLGTLCVLGRLFLVVEAFISLRKVPIAVYQTPDWTQWIPHL